MDKQCGICIQWNILALKTKEILTLATRWMNLEDMLRNKQSYKEKYRMIHRDKVEWRLQGPREGRMRVTV